MLLTFDGLDVFHTLTSLKIIFICGLQTQISEFTGFRISVMFHITINWVSMTKFSSALDSCTKYILLQTKTNILCVVLFGETFLELNLCI